jgi:putative transposase
MYQITDTARLALLAGEAGFDPIEERLRVNVRATIEAVFEEELAGFLGRPLYGRGDGAAKGYRHGHRERQLTATFGTETVRVPRPDRGRHWQGHGMALEGAARYQRPTRKAEALIAAVYLGGTITRRVKRAQFGLF